MDKISFLLNKTKNKLLSPIYSTYQRRLIENVKKKEPPVHIGFILDGNRRYATAKGLDRKIGHMFGAKKVEELLEWCFDINIKVVTLYAFSTENFNRPEEEVGAIMDLAKEEFEKVLTSKSIHENKVRVEALGDLDKLPRKLLEAIQIAEDNTKDYCDHFLNVCVAYGSKNEIVSAVRNIAKDVKEGRLGPDEITYNDIRKNLLTNEYP
ncbi:MAG TPA: polyprenyl diphosphate synthase, partial [Candidatus Methanofastidiosa archaeon]|nr:polyprenyl diphosphate synthase [Candidatus Methanofastidiosa archaeon]